MVSTSVLDSGVEAARVALFHTPFGLEISANGIGCLYCPRGEAEKLCLAERYLLAYHIKEKHGLLTDLEKELLPGLRIATKTLLTSRRDTELNRELDELWNDLHGGRPGCLQPAEWQKGRKLMVWPSV